MYICICHAVTDRDIQKAVASGARTVPELKLKTGCSTACGRCEETVQELLSDALSFPPALRIVGAVGQAA